MGMSLEKTAVPSPFEQEAHQMGGSLTMFASLVKGLNFEFKVDVRYLDTFISEPTSWRIWNTQLQRV